MDEDLLMIMRECQKIIDFMEKDRDSIEMCLGGDLSQVYQETVELELDALNKIKDHLKNIE